VTGDHFAIAARADRDWRALCAPSSGPRSRTTPRYATAPAKRAMEELEGGPTRAFRRAASTRAPWPSPIRSSPRGHFVDVPHPTIGRTVIEAPRFQLSRTPAVLSDPAPSFGDSTQWVLESVLGYDDDRMPNSASSNSARPTHELP
jgi:crotonobetainyl-CoA:carnitine CoA-transferase CaiB-like acyl-CoA transferase